MRVLITGVGTELGYRVAAALDRDPAVTELVGLDSAAPRRRVRSMHVVTLSPSDRRHILRAVREYEPTALVHLATWEPDARVAARPAAQRTSAMAIAVLGAAAELPSLQRLVVRSNIAVYGRGRGSAIVPDESVPPVPTTPWGRSLLEVERLAAAAGHSAGVPTTALRFAPLVGRWLPSPLARYLRLPVVGFSALADPPFSVVEVEDAAAAVVAALHRQPDGPLNVVGSGAATVSQAALIGRRIPWPVVGPEWLVLRRLAGLGGVGLPGHLLELIHRGQTADGSAAMSTLGVVPSSTLDVIRAVYGWTPPPDLQLVKGAA